MYRIKLINMPFAALRLPSLALTQLSTMVEERFGREVDVSIHYLNQELGRHLGVPFYSSLADGSEASVAGLGEWLFRQEAFPDLADNHEEYCQRYFPVQHADVQRRVLEMRQGLGAWLDRMIDEHGLADADLVGFTSMFSQNVASFALARKIKARAPNTIIVMGGANCEPPMGDQIAAHVPAIDYVFAGPALCSFVTFVERAMAGDREGCANIRGVTSRARASRMLAGPGTMLGQELDINVPVTLDYRGFLDALSVNFPEDNVLPTILFETSRGCWWGERAHCTFCGLNGSTMKYRHMEAKLAVESLNQLFDDTQGVLLYQGVDNIMPRSYVQDVLPRLTPAEDAVIFYEVKADVSEADVRAMALANVKLIQPGIEALATSTLKLMKKGCSSFQNVALLKHCITYDVAPIWNLLVGFPGEGEEVYRKYLVDVPSLVHLPPPNGVFPVRFDRFSPYFTKAKEYGLELAPLDFYGMVYPFGAPVLADMAYYFTDTNVGAPYITAVAQWIARLRLVVAQWRTRWSEADPVDFPQLCFTRGNPFTIRDSRKGAVRHHALDEIEQRCLFALETPLTVERLTAELRDVAQTTVADTIERLHADGLLFHEGGRLISLVHRHEPAVPRAVLRQNGWERETARAPQRTTAIAATHHEENHDERTGTAAF